MTNPSELTEAIERYRAFDYMDKSTGCIDHSYCIADAHLIAEAFTDPAEITRESLLAVGFEVRAASLLKLAVGNRVACHYHGRIGEMIDQDFYECRPPCGTMGDVAYLLYRLGRTKETR